MASLGWTALAAWWLCGSASAATVEVIGATHLPEAEVRETVGSPGPDAALDVWGTEAVERIVDRYRARGFVAARGWATVDGDAVTLEVDEGYIHRYAFRGASSLEQLTLSDNLILPDGVLELATLEAQLDVLREAHDVVGVSWSLERGDAWVRTETAGLVREQVLQVSIGKEEPVGVDLDVDFDSLWGVITGLWYGEPSALAELDYLRVGVQLAFPLHEYIWEQDPQIRWVFGAVSGEYRFRPIGQTQVAPDVEVFVSLQQYPRLDRGIRALLFHESDARVTLNADPPGPFQLTVGFTTYRADVFRVDREDGVLPNREDYERGVMRGGLYLRSELEFEDGTLRSDLRDRAKVTIIGDLGGVAPFLRTTFQGQWVEDLWRGQLYLARARIVYLDGDVRIYDEERLAGSTQRCTFGDVYYVHKAAQAEVAFRWPVRRSLHLGVFYDQSAFEDISDLDAPVVAWANAFGPSVHVLLVDHFSLDAYGAIGYGPESLVRMHDRPSRWAQSVFLSFKSVY